MALAAFASFRFAVLNPYKLTENRDHIQDRQFESQVSKATSSDSFSANTQLELSERLKRQANSRT